MSITYRPHQDFAHEECRRLYHDHVPAWCVVSPCGGGKSLMMRRIAIPAASRGLKVFIYCNRIMLLKQTIDAFDRDGVDIGVIAATHDDRCNPDAAIQVCSIQTVISRLGNSRYHIPIPRIVIVDEYHQMQGDESKAVLMKHAKDGAQIIGYTATPVDLAGVHLPPKTGKLSAEQIEQNRIACRELVMAGTYQDMLDCKAHMPVVCYGPDRPNLTLKKMLSTEISESENREANCNPTIFANVYDNWRKLNPKMLPAVGFAPGVQESKWFVEEFMRRDVPCAHIDGSDAIIVYRDSPGGQLVAEQHDATEEWRQHIIQGSRDGRYKIVFNRFVLREAVDCVEWYQAILATTVDSLSNYLQMTGRILRHCDRYDHKLIVDHGGCIDRHGFPNVDREWLIGDSDESMHRKEIERRKKSDREDAEPICCPKCNAYRLSGKVCNNCGHRHVRSVRMVRQLDGSLVPLTGRIVKHRPERTIDDYLKDALYACASSGRSVYAAFCMAKGNAAKKGVTDFTTRRIKLPANGSPDWSKPVREVYPWFKPKRRQVAQ